MAKIVYRQMPAPRELPQQIPTPQAKARMQQPQGGGTFLVQIPGVRGGGGMVACINASAFRFVLCFKAVDYVGKGFAI